MQRRLFRRSAWLYSEMISVSIIFHAHDVCPVGLHLIARICKKMFVEINCHMAHGPAQINLDTRHNAQTGSVYVLTFLIQHSLAEFIFTPITSL